MMNRGSNVSAEVGGSGGSEDELYEPLWMESTGERDVPRAGQRVFYLPQGHMEQTVLENKAMTMNHSLPGIVEVFVNCDDEYDGDVHSDIDDPSTLISQPRWVNKIEVEYDKTSKQVDVQALKVTLCLFGTIFKNLFNFILRVKKKRYLSGIYWPTFLVNVMLLQLLLTYLRICVSYAYCIWLMRKG